MAFAEKSVQQNPQNQLYVENTVIKIKVIIYNNKTSFLAAGLCCYLLLQQ